MKIIKGMLLLAMIILAAFAGFYLCKDAKKTENNIEEAVMI